MQSSTAWKKLRLFLLTALSRSDHNISRYIYDWSNVNVRRDWGNLLLAGLSALIFLFKTKSSSRCKSWTLNSQQQCDRLWKLEKHCRQVCTCSTVSFKLFSFCISTLEIRGELEEAQPVNQQICEVVQGVSSGRRLSQLLFIHPFYCLSHIFTGSQHDSLHAWKETGSEIPIIIPHDGVTSFNWIEELVFSNSITTLSSAVSNMDQWSHISNTNGQFPGSYFWSLYSLNLWHHITAAPWTLFELTCSSTVREGTSGLFSTPTEGTCHHPQEPQPHCSRLPA